MKLNEPIIENVETASEAYESAIELNKNQQSVLEDLKNDLHKYISSENGRKVIHGEDFVQGFIDKFDHDINREIVSNQLSSIINGFDEDETYRLHKLGQMIDAVDSNMKKNKQQLVKNLSNLESFRWKIEEGYQPDSEYLPKGWTPSETYIGTEEHKHAIDVELFRSTLVEDNLKQTSLTERLEVLEESIEYLEELIGHNQKIINEDIIEANEVIYEGFADFKFPILDGLLRGLRTAKNEKKGLEHFLIHEDEHDYLLHRWKNILEDDLSRSNWKVYGEEIDYFEDEAFTDKNMLPEKLDADFWRDGEFDLLLKNEDQYAYVEVKSFETDENDETAEDIATKQLKELDKYDSVLILKDGGYERIQPDEMKKFWANQKPFFDTNYATQIENASEDITRLEGSEQV
mgnify:CR=1 FL=1